MRKTKPYTDGFFHIFNKTLNGEILFPNSQDYQRFLTTIQYYKQTFQPLRLSFYLQFCQLNKQPIQLDGDPIVTIYAYCLMPTHFHLLLKQKTDNGIAQFMHKLQVSYTKYLNSIYNRQGHLFQGKYKLVEIDSEEAFLHVSRYIHLNPSTAGIVEPDQLNEYPYSSYYEITHPNLKNKIADTSLFINKHRSNQQYQQFVLDNADYQRKLAKIKRYILE